ncbi:MAG: DUF2252 domain-containing protein [Thermoleophilia bacterium]|jgi:uncharacterized protein (DUF2252 family)|nr:DUF2252 domain-containing protein [Thermoleophilia bacterium]
MADKDDGRRVYLKPDERAALGREARAAVRRADLGEYAPAKDRRDPVAILEEQGADRQQDLLPIRYGRMSVSPFTFLRGSAAVMAADLAASPVTGLRVQAIGDAHLSNFGVFATPERRLVFDVNDFDETLPGPWEWDVKRLVASVVVAAEDNGADRAAATAAARRTAAAYRLSMRRFADDTTLDVWYAHLDFEDWVRTRSRKSRQAANARFLQKTRARTSAQVVGKLTEVVAGELRFKDQSPLVSPLRDLVPPDEEAVIRDRLRRGFAGYRQSLAPERRHLLDEFRFVDVARKVVGVGSVGTRCLIALFRGRRDDDHLVLQFKEATASVLEPFAGASRYRQHGARVVHGQRLVQVASDVFLGWTALKPEGHHYYWRQLKDMKGSIELGWLDAKAFDRYLEGCAWCLARAHARSGDPIAIAAYLGSGTAFDKAMGAFAAAYADQTKQDWEALKAAIADGRLEALTGV